MREGMMNSGGPAYFFLGGGRKCPQASKGGEREESGVKRDGVEVSSVQPSRSALHLFCS